MKKVKKVLAPEGCQDYLTAGRIYDVVKFWGVHGDLFTIIADNGLEAFCQLTKCLHLKRKDWIIIETE